MFWKLKRKKQKNMCYMLTETDYKAMSMSILAITHIYFVSYILFFILENILYETKLSFS